MNEPQSSDILRTIEQEMDSDIHPLLKKILDNIKSIGLVIGGIILVVAVYSGYSAYTDSRQAEATEKFGEIMLQPDPKERISHLEAFAANAPSDMLIAVHLELAKTLMETGAFDRAAQSWETVAATDERARVFAGLGKAKSLMMRQEYSQAMDVLHSIKALAGEGLSPLISSTLAFAAEKAGQKDVAVAEYEAMKAADPSISPYAEYKIAQLKNIPN